METNTFLRSIDATTDAAAPILVSMEGYVGSKDGGRPISSKLIPFDRHQIEIRLVKYER